MISCVEYPRVLILAIGRVNESDPSNNGLLLRNLFEGWPRERLGQIYSSGDLGDPGFFGHYYSLRHSDRSLGKLFFALRRVRNSTADASPPTELTSNVNRYTAVTLVRAAKRILLEQGLHELLFRPKISVEMATWLDDFRPDIVLCQGYSLAFARLPMIIAERLKIPIAYYPTDDWPSDLYRTASRTFLNNIVRAQVQRVATGLVASATLRIAFNEYMQAAYRKRYGVPFHVLRHGDHARRFEDVAARRETAAHIPRRHFLIIGAGVFDRHRYPLIRDISDACDLLRAAGLEVRVRLYPVNRVVLPTPVHRNVEILPCPAHAELVSALACADALWLPERFDDTSSDIGCSISSKAPLFMYSNRPIIVYAHPETGVAKYSRQENWAICVDKRDVRALAAAIMRVLTDETYRSELVRRAAGVALKNHNLSTIQSQFRTLIAECAQVARSY